MTVSYDRVALLGSVLDATRQLPKLSDIHNLAMLELEAINESAKGDLVKAREANEKMALAKVEAVQAQAARDDGHRVAIPAEVIEKSNEANLRGQPVHIKPEPVDRSSESNLRVGEANEDAMPRRV